MRISFLKENIFLKIAYSWSLIMPARVSPSHPHWVLLLTSLYMAPKFIFKIAFFPSYLGAWFWKSFQGGAAHFSAGKRHLLLERLLVGCYFFKRMFLLFFNILISLYYCSTKVSCNYFWNVIFSTGIGLKVGCMFAIVK